MAAKVVWSTFQDPESRYPRFVRAANDVVLLVEGSMDGLALPMRALQVCEGQIPSYFDVVAADADDNLFLFVDGYLKRLDSATKQTTDLAYTAPDHFFDYEFAISRDGMLIGACSLFFTMVSEAGEILRICKFGTCNLDGFDVPPGSDEPFWDYPLSLPSSVDTFQNSFVLGGTPVEKLYKYTFEGNLCLTLEEVIVGKEIARFDQEILTKVRFDETGRIWASTLDHLFLFANQGELIRYWNWSDLDFMGEPVDSFFGVGSDNILYVTGRPKAGKLPLGAIQLAG